MSHSRPGNVRNTGNLAIDGGRVEDYSPQPPPPPDNNQQRLPPDLRRSMVNPGRQSPAGFGGVIIAWFQWLFASLKETMYGDRFWLIIVVSVIIGSLVTMYIVWKRVKEEKEFNET